jgi:hypothetical protein
MVEIEVRLLPDSILPITIPPGVPINFGKLETNGFRFPLVFGRPTVKQLETASNGEDIELEFGQLTIYLNPDKNTVVPDDEWMTVPIKVKVPRSTKRLRSQLEPTTKKRFLNKSLF